MKPERRCVERRRPGGISYFEFEAGSGGIVLDASEKGLAFQSADAVHQLGPSRIFISPHPEERIELKGDVVWTDKTGKTGGLRFIDPGADSCTRIRNWLKQPNESGVAQTRQDSPLRSWALNELADTPPARSKPDASPKMAPPRQMEVCAERPVEPRRASVVPSLYVPDLTWHSQESPGPHGRLLRRLATAFLIAALVLACVAAAQNFGFVEKFRPKVADALIRLGEKLKGNTGTPSRNSSAAQGSNQFPAQPPSAGLLIPSAPQAETPAGNSGQPNASAQNPPQAARPAVPRVRQTVEPHPRARRFGRERSAEANRLWSAVGAGSPSAEADLALLYLKGEGVPRNCEQAKILLQAGAKGGSREARQQLQKLRMYGCQ